MNITKITRGMCSLRSLANIRDDLERFDKCGKDPKMAKLCNNVIADAFFDIPLDQVTINALSFKISENVL